MEKEEFLNKFSKDKFIVSKIPDALRDDEEVIKKICRNWCFLDNLIYASPRIQKKFSDDEKFIFNTVRYYGPNLKYASERLQDDFRICAAALQCDYDTFDPCEDSDPFEYVSDRLKNDREFVLTIARTTNRFFYGYFPTFPKKFSDDFEICLAAVSKNCYFIKYCSDRLRDNEHIVFAAISKQFNHCAFGLISERLQKVISEDKFLMWTLVHRDPKMIYFASKQLKEDPDIIKAANISKAIINTPTFRVYGHQSPSLDYPED